MPGVLGVSQAPRHSGFPADVYRERAASLGLALLVKHRWFEK